MNIEILIQKAIKAMENSYSPYSNFKVGAALLAQNGEIFTGCNVENAGYSATNCAERTAFFKAVSEGVTTFNSICVVGGKNGVLENFTAPCGICRQVMVEFCKDDFKIILATSTDNYKIYTLKELLPMAFGPNNL
ncbi:MAG: cytidine deaminase [Clostridia bacterium]